MRLRRGRSDLIVVIVFVVGGAVACTHGRAGRSGAPATVATTTAGVGESGMSMGGTSAAGTAAKLAPAQLGVQFDQLLGRHALLAVRLMRSVVMVAPDFRQAVVGSLQQNTATLSQLVGSAYGSAQGQRFQLRSAFAMLLGEHMELIIDAQRATFAGSQEFNAAATQVNANTTALAQGLGAIVGPRKCAEFQSDWADHVAGLMAYTAAVASKDQAGKATAEQNLQGFAVTLATYFSSVVRNPSAVVPLTAAITAHDTHLVDQVNAYAVRDYTTAQQMESHGYQQMLGVANTLVDAIQRVVTPGLPSGGSQTGGG